MSNSNLKKISPSLAETVRVLAVYPNKYLSTYELVEAGIYYPSQTVQALKQRGAIIDKIIKPAHDKHGKLHQRVAHYRFRGWPYV